MARTFCGGLTTSFDVVVYVGEDEANSYRLHLAQLDVAAGELSWRIVDRKRHRRGAHTVTSP